MKVQNLNQAKNQFIITADNGTRFFQSYNSIICKIEREKVTLDQRFWDYSTTTSKYRNMFLNETKKETEAKIQAGIYLLADLN